MQIAWTKLDMITTVRLMCDGATHVQEEYYAILSYCWCSLVDEHFQLIDANILVRWWLIQAQPHFNVITHFLAQCGSEPWTTTITASAPTCTPLWVPQRVIKVPLVFIPSSVPRLAKIVIFHEWRCSLTRIRVGTGAGFRIIKVFGQPCCKRPDVVTRADMCYYQTLNIRKPSKRDKFSKPVWWSVLVPTSSSTDLSV